MKPIHLVIALSIIWAVVNGQKTAPATSQASFDCSALEARVTAVEQAICDLGTRIEAVACKCDTQPKQVIDEGPKPTPVAETNIITLGYDDNWFEQQLAANGWSVEKDYTLGRAALVWTRKSLHKVAGTLTGDLLRRIIALPVGQRGTCRIWNGVRVCN